MTLKPFKLFFLPILLVCILSCDKKREGSQLGPEVQIHDIIAAQDASLSKLDPYTVKLGQKIHKIETQELVTSQGPVKAMSKESTFEVTEVENFPDVRLLTTLKKVIDYQLKDNFLYEIKNVFALEQLDEIPAATIHQSINDEFNIHTMVNRKVSSSEIQGFSFHNLLKREVVLVPPQKVLESEDCRQLSPCEIKSDLITYDVVFHLDDGTTQKHNLEWYISSEVPFFAGILKQCATTLVPVEDLRVLVKQCNEVVDFNP